MMVVPTLFAPEAEGGTFASDIIMPEQEFQEEKETCS